MASVLSAVDSRGPDLVGLSSTLASDVASLEAAVSQLEEAFALLEGMKGDSIGAADRD